MRMLEGVSGSAEGSRILRSMIEVGSRARRFGAGRFQARRYGYGRQGEEGQGQEGRAEDGQAYAEGKEEIEEGKEESIIVRSCAAILD